MFAQRIISFEKSLGHPRICEKLHGQRKDNEEHQDDVCNGFPTELCGHLVDDEDHHDRADAHQNLKIVPLSS